MQIKIKNNRLGYNCGCSYCHKVQEGIKPQPFLVWVKGDIERRGKNYPVCCKECADALVERFNKNSFKINVI